jgi:hypothetical protein
MKFGKVSLVLVVVIALVGVYFFAPNLLSGVASDEARLTIRLVNVPSYVPIDDLTIYSYLDGSPMDIDDSFTVKVGSSHSFQINAFNPDGTLYSSYAKMFTAPDQSGSYILEFDATTRVVTVISQ